MAFEHPAMVSTVTLEKTTFFSNGKCCASKCQEAKEEKEKWNKESKCELVSYDSLPNFLKHNEFILDHYRSEWPMKQTILSIFSIHNETINIWTHLIGFFIFLSLTTCAMSILPINPSSFTTNSTTSLVLNSNLDVFPSFTLPLNLTQPSQSSCNTDETPMAVARWPFYAYMFGAMFCLLMSSTCHLLSCHSEHACYHMLRLDYAGISALIVTSFYPLVYYSFLCHPFIRNVYLSSITIFGAGAILVSLVPIFETPEFRYARAGLFACMGLSGLVPIVHKLIVFGDRPEAVATAGYEAVMGMFYALGVVVYALRVPERWMPGRFDLAGHSHQLFHVLVIAGAYTHYLAGLVYLSWREVEGC